jgi:hypothetical protein
MAQVTGRMWLLGRVFSPEQECAGDLGLKSVVTVGSLPALGGQASWVLETSLSNCGGASMA